MPDDPTGWWYHGEARGSVLPASLRGKLFRGWSGDAVGALLDRGCLGHVLYQL